MIKAFDNKFRGGCGSVQSISGQVDSNTKQLDKPARKDRLPDCAYLLHAGIASAHRHRTKTT